MLVLLWKEQAFKHYLGGVVFRMTHKGITHTVLDLTDGILVTWNT
jgi:hypothetical protein